MKERKEFKNKDTSAELVSVLTLTNCDWMLFSNLLETVIAASNETVLENS